MFDFYYINISLLCASFLFNLLVCFTTKLMPLNGFFKLSKIGDISYSIFNYCITNNNSTICSNSKIGYDNRLFLDMKQPQYLTLLFNEIKDIDTETLINAMKLGKVSLSSNEESSITFEDLIELSSAFNVYSFNKYKLFLEMPANNGFSSALIFHVFNCLFCALTIIALILLRHSFSKHDFVLLKDKPREILTKNKNLTTILNSYLILRFVSGLLTLLTIIVDFGLFAPFISLLVILSTVSALLLSLIQIYSVRYFKGISNLLQYECDGT